MDRKLREEIVAEVSKAVTAALLNMQEQWLSADELCKQFQMFNSDWIAKYGDVLPRKKVHVTETISGKKRGSHWAYPRFRIAQNIANGVYDDMKLLR